MNFVPVKVAEAAASGTRIVLPKGATLTLPPGSGALPAGSSGTLGLRPEGIAFQADGPIAGDVSVVEHLGGETLAYVDIGDGTLVTVKVAGDDPVRVGESVRLGLKSREPLLFDAEGKAVSPSQRERAA